MEFNGFRSSHVELLSVPDDVFLSCCFCASCQMPNFAIPTKTSPAFLLQLVSEANVQSVTKIYICFLFLTASPPALDFPIYVGCVETRVLGSVVNLANLCSEYTTPDGRTFYFHWMTGESIWKQNGLNTPTSIDSWPKRMS